jgi:predicted  nucleic acid-binding Zn-ribbon protein
MTGPAWSLALRCTYLQVALDEAGETIKRLGDEADRLATVVETLQAQLVDARERAKDGPWASEWFAAQLEARAAVAQEIAQAMEREAELSRDDDDEYGHGRRQGLRLAATIARTLGGAR